MTPVWDIVKKHFKIEENWGDWKMIDPNLLFILYLIRLQLNIPIHINNAYSKSGHSVTGYHPKGQAVDFYLETDLPFDIQVEMILQILKFLGIEDLVGFGVYPDWNIKGFHIDNRGFKSRWGRIDIKVLGENKKKYVSIEKAMTWWEYIKC